MHRGERIVSLLFLQLLRGIRLRGFQGLPEDGEEGDQQGDDGRDGKDPSVTFNPIPELPEITFGQEYGDGDPDDDGDSDQDHVFRYSPFGLRLHGPPEDLAYSDALGLKSGVVGTHRDKPHQGDQDGNQHEQFYEPDEIMRVFHAALNEFRNGTVIIGDRLVTPQTDAFLPSYFLQVSTDFLIQPVEFENHRGLSQEIVDNDYDLSINKYKKTIYVPVEYPPTSELLSELDSLYKELGETLNELGNLLNK